LPQWRVALISTAGLHRRDDRPFPGDLSDGEELKAYYGEALAAQPGHSPVDSTTLVDWCWRDTTAGRVLFAVQEVWKESAIPCLQVVATGLLIPRARSVESPFAKT
jgi:hypothetical protein